MIASTLKTSSINGTPAKMSMQIAVTPTKEREAWLKENGYRNQIQRKGNSNKPLSECQQRRNRCSAKTRARVEHIFGAIEQMGGKAIRTIGQSRANFAMTMMATCYNVTGQSSPFFPKT